MIIKEIWWSTIIASSVTNVQLVQISNLVPSATYVFFTLGRKTYWKKDIFNCYECKKPWGQNWFFVLSGKKLKQAVQHKRETYRETSRIQTNVYIKSWRNERGWVVVRKLLIVWISFFITQFFDIPPPARPKITTGHKVKWVKFVGRLICSVLWKRVSTDFLPWQNKHAF